MGLYFEEKTGAAFYHAPVFFLCLYIGNFLWLFYGVYGLTLLLVQRAG